jgi:hypothetical protein
MIGYSSGWLSGQKNPGMRPAANMGGLRARLKFETAAHEHQHLVYCSPYFPTRC